MSVEVFDEDLICKKMIYTDAQYSEFFYLGNFHFHRNFLHYIFMFHSSIYLSFFISDNLNESIYLNSSKDVLKANKIKCGMRLCGLVLLDNIFREYLYVVFRKNKEDSFLNQFSLFKKATIDSYFGLKYLLFKSRLDDKSESIIQKLFDDERNEIENVNSIMNIKININSIHNIMRKIERLEIEIKNKQTNLCNTSPNYLMEINEIEILKNTKSKLKEKVLALNKINTDFNNFKYI